MPPGEPIVSVIVPTYNCSGSLRLTLETLVRQDLKGFEAWVVGDACTDDSSEVVASFHDSRLCWTNLPENSGGPSRPRNEALGRARGKYIAYLGHDDLWFPWHLSSLLSSIEASGASFVHSLGALIAPDGCYAAFSLPRVGCRDERIAVSPSNWMHSKDVIETIGPWATRLKTGDDREFIRRVWESGLQISNSRQLSVLKFPAVLWRMYALRQDYPQTRYVEAMRDDPRNLQHRLMIDLGISFSQQPNPSRSERGATSSVLRRLASRALQRYGRNRWPVNQILYRSWRRRAGLD